MPDNDAIDTTAPHIGSPLAGLGPDTIKNIALQSRPLTAKESAAIKQTFGTSIDPDDMRLAFDAGASGTNLKGYVLGKHLPTVMFFSPDEHDELPSDLLHEATHVWQNLTNDRYTGKGVVATKDISGNRMPAYQYDRDAATSRPFTEFGVEQQPEMVQANENSAKAFVKAHAGKTPPKGDMAFLDSVRSRYVENSPLRTAADDPARASAFQPNAFSVLDRSGGNLNWKPESELKKNVKSGGHNVVLENLRTKFPNYRSIPDGKLLAALLHTHPEYAQHVGPNGLRLALETGHKPNGTN